MYFWTLLAVFSLIYHLNEEVGVTFGQILTFVNSTEVTAQIEALDVKFS